MTIEKREESMALYDIYRELLTEKQRQYFEDYYFEDLSISEIADNRDVSRNAVFDQIKRVTLILTDYERKLKWLSKTKQISNLVMPQVLKDEIMNILKEE